MKTCGDEVNNVVALFEEMISTGVTCAAFVIYSVIRTAIIGAIY